VGGSAADPMTDTRKAEPPSAAAQPPLWSAILEVQDPDGTRTRHPFRHPRMAVGRQRDNDLSLADEGVSHRHCEFVAEQGFFVARDLGSQNGTFLNERRVREAKLRDGDEVRIGKTRIRIALEGNVRRPERRGRGRAVGIVVGFAAAGAIWWWLAQRQASAMAAYLAAARQQPGGNACLVPQLDALEAVDAKIAGRSFGLVVDKGAVRLSGGDEALDRELSALYKRKLALYEETYRALMAAQAPRREAAEKLARSGRRLWTARGRKSAAFIDGLLQQNIEAVDELAQAVKQLGDDTAQLTATVDALLAPQPDPQTAEHLRVFRFRGDLRSARAACEDQNAQVMAGLSGALTALAE
jgi:hypothetical protein